MRTKLFHVIGLTLCRFLAVGGVIAPVCVSPADDLSGRLIVQSHRGAGELAPENTIEAFELGWSLGTIPEADVRTTRDGVIVAFHDADFRRVVRNAGPELANKTVADVTFAELSRLDVGSWRGEEFQGRRVSRLSEVFDAMKGWPARRLYLDIKDVNLNQLASEVRARNVEAQVILASTKQETITGWKQLVPRTETLLWMGGAEAELRRRLEILRATNYKDVTQLQVHVRLNTNNGGTEPFNLSRKFLLELGRELQARGVLYQALPWGVSDPAVYRQLMEAGVESFATDHPKIALQAMRDYRAGRQTNPEAD